MDHSSHEDSLPAALPVCNTFIFFQYAVLFSNGAFCIRNQWNVHVTQSTLLLRSIDPEEEEEYVRKERTQQFRKLQEYSVHVLEYLYLFAELILQLTASLMSWGKGGNCSNLAIFLGQIPALLIGIDRNKTLLLYNCCLLVLL